MFRRRLCALALAVVVADALVLGGCRMGTDFSEEHRQVTSTVTVQKGLEMPDEAYYDGPASGWARVFGGAIGGLLLESEADEREALENLVESREVDIEAMVREEIHQNFVASNPVGRVVEENGDAEFQFKVLRYGMGLAAFTMSVRPNLAIQGKLVREDGTVLWERGAGVGITTSGLPKNSFEGWVADLDAMRAAFRQAVKIAVDELVEDLREKERS